MAINNIPPYHIYVLSKFGSVTNQNAMSYGLKVLQPNLEIYRRHFKYRDAAVWNIPLWMQQHAC